MGFSISRARARARVMSPRSCTSLPWYSSFRTAAKKGPTNFTKPVCLEDREVEVQIRSIQGATPRPPDLLDVIDRQLAVDRSSWSGQG
jgi:hypothetical protein